MRDRARPSTFLLPCLIWLAGVATPFVLRLVPSIVAPGVYATAFTRDWEWERIMLLFALWDSFPLALLASLKAEIDRDPLLLRHQRFTDNAAIATAFVITLAPEAWIYRPTRHASPFYFVPVVAYPIAGFVIVVVVYGGVRLALTTLYGWRS
jgi:hypothetical protein